MKKISFTPLHGWVTYSDSRTNEGNENHNLHSISKKSERGFLC